MRTIEQAIAEESARYVDACRAHAMHLAHIRRVALQRLRHSVLTDHEAALFATPTAHAYSDLDGYGAGK